jgi:GH15 family glucan-1,4-alpha-glucosidase
MSRTRIDGYAPIRDYAAIGDGRTVALIASDGSIDWLCLPDLDSPSVFGALLDSERGGKFALEPEAECEATRRYLPGTNVLETTFRTASGVARVVDALNLPARSSLSPDRELVRRVEGVAGEVPLRWHVEPRFCYGIATTSVDARGGVPRAQSGRDALALRSWDAGEATVGNGVIRGRFVARDGSRSLLVLAAAHQEPLVLPGHADVETRLEDTIRFWRGWSAARGYDGPWKEEVLRSALALKLLVFAPSGAIAAAPTTSLPEEIGGARNWDYRFAWPRDAVFTLEALLTLGCSGEARAFFWWLMHASQLTHPKLHVLYRLDGNVQAGERSLPLDGYRGSRPARAGNGAAGQTQLDVYGELLEAAARLAASEGGLDRDHGRRLAGVADYICKVWEAPDSGIWELRGRQEQLTQSKMMCAVALARAAELAEDGFLPSRHLSRWRREESRIREFVERRCYSASKRSYVRSAEDEALDASLLLAVINRYDQPTSPRLVETVDAVRRELAQGPLIRRYLGEDGLEGEEGAFLACSFWLAEAYARQGRLEEAAELMDELVPLANDVGLYSEELDPESAEFLGNFPQGMSHLALVTAAVAYSRAEEAQNE